MRCRVPSIVAFGDGKTKKVIGRGWFRGAGISVTPVRSDPMRGFPGWLGFNVGEFEPYILASGHIPTYDRF